MTAPAVSLTSIDMYSHLLGFKKTHGGDALAAVLRKLGVKNASELTDARLDEVKMTCSLGVAGLQIVDGEDAETGASDSLASVARGAQTVPDAMNAMASKLYGDRRKAAADAGKAGKADT